jgi:large subunit ribosomal protein L21
MKDKTAVIALGGKQHLVAVGDKIVVNRLQAEAGKDLDAEVLLVSEGEKTSVGTPNVAGASVSLKVASHDKAKKIVVAHFRAKSRYRRKQGHRQPQTTVEVVAINA